MKTLNILAIMISTLFVAVAQAQVINIQTRNSVGMLNAEGSIEIDLLDEAYRQSLIRISDVYDINRVAFKATAGVGGGRATLMVNNIYPFTADFETQENEWVTVEIYNYERNVTSAVLILEGDVQISNLQLVFGDIKNVPLLGKYPGAEAAAKRNADLSNQPVAPQDVGGGTVSNPDRPIRVVVQPNPPAPQPEAPTQPVAPQRPVGPTEPKIEPRRVDPKPEVKPEIRREQKPEEPKKEVVVEAPCLSTGNLKFCVCDTVKTLHGYGFDAMVVAVSSRKNTITLKMSHRDDLVEVKPNEEFKMTGKFRYEIKSDGRAVCRK